MNKTIKDFSHGFTLIELLVVVSIIALLVSILLPALGKAREQARSVVCSSNQHQIGLGVLFYAEDNNEFMPPNSLWSQYEPYLVYSHPGRFHNIGHLYNLGYFDQPELVYCPSDRMHKLDIQTNPWYENSSYPVTPGFFTRSSYYYFVRIDNVFWNSSILNDWYGRGRCNLRQYSRKLSEVKEWAILSDNIYLPDYPHAVRNGFNVLYKDGSVKMWFDQNGFYKTVAAGGASVNQVYALFNWFDTNY